MEDVRLGHWTEAEGRTGCTVVIFPEGSVASGEVRGGAPATREFDLLDPRRMVQHVDAVILSGGSAFGLAAADGVMDELVAAERGFPTRAGNVPIVVAMSLFDLEEGVPRPSAAEGRAAAQAATATPDAWATGRVGAGAGATVGKWRGPEHKSPGGLGIATVTSSDLRVTAVIAVNATGDIDDGTTVRQVLGGDHVPPAVGSDTFENTTIGVAWTNASLSKLDCRAMAEAAHDGFGRALIPAHTSGDGDAVVAVATQRVDADLSTVRLLTTVAVEQAIRTCRPG